MTSPGTPVRVPIDFYYSLLGFQHCEGIPTLRLLQPDTWPHISHCDCLSHWSLSVSQSRHVSRATRTRGSKALSTLARMLDAEPWCSPSVVQPAARCAQLAVRRRGRRGALHLGDENTTTYDSRVAQIGGHLRFCVWSCPTCHWGTVQSWMPYAQSAHPSNTALKGCGCRLLSSRLGQGLQLGVLGSALVPRQVGHVTCLAAF
jgi:hypothetical protein